MVEPGAFSQPVVAATGKNLVSGLSMFRVLRPQTAVVTLVVTPVGHSCHLAPVVADRSSCSHHLYIVFTDVTRRHHSHFRFAQPPCSGTFRDTANPATVLRQLARTFSSVVLSATAMTICAMFGCRSRSKTSAKPTHRESGTGMFCLPKVITKQCKRTRALSERRRNVCLARINRKDLKNLDNIRICGRHFITGKTLIAVI